MAAKETKKEETKTPETTAIAEVQKPGALSLVVDWGGDAGAGFEHQGKGDTALAFINLLQALSPLVSQEKAKPGDFYNTLTEQLYSRNTGFLFVPATTRRMVVQWGPRDSDDAGFHGTMDLSDPRFLNAIKNAEKFGKNKLGGDSPRAQDSLQETAYLYGIVLNDDMSFEGYASIPCASTKLKPYRTLMGRLQQILTKNPTSGRMERAPLNSHLIRVTSAMPPDVDPKKAYYVPVFKPGRGMTPKDAMLAPDDEAYQMAGSLRNLLDAGDVKIDYSKQRAQEGEDEEAQGSPGSGVGW